VGVRRGPSTRALRFAQDDRSCGGLCGWIGMTWGLGAAWLDRDDLVGERVGGFGRVWGSSGSFDCALRASLRMTGSGAARCAQDDGCAETLGDCEGCALVGES
jgi:hypothetical protein